MYLPGFSSTAHRRGALALTGFLGLVTPLSTGALWCCGLPCRPFRRSFVSFAWPGYAIVASIIRPPPAPDAEPWINLGFGRRYLEPPCSMETTGSPKFPEEPL